MTDGTGSRDGLTYLDRVCTARLIVMGRVVSSEISVGKFPEISGNLL